MIESATHNHRRKESEDWSRDSLGSSQQGTNLGSWYNYDEEYSSTMYACNDKDDFYEPTKRAYQL